MNFDNGNKHSALESSGPFGDADAARVDFNKLKEAFVSLSSNPSLPIESNYDPSTRIIVGRKGAGKTLYIRSIQDQVRKLGRDQPGSTVYVTELDNNPPDSYLIVKFSTFFQENDAEAVEGWRAMWKMAILRSVYSHLFFKEELHKYVTHAKRDEFQSEYGRVLPSINKPTSINQQLAILLAKFNSERDFRVFCEGEEWSAFESDLGDCLKNAPPMYFFLDQLDDDFANSPRHWLLCHYGLFNTIFRLVRSNVFGGRLHVVACIRELVYVYMLNSQHGSKNLTESKIKVLRWDIHLAMQFLERKIELLDSKYFAEGHLRKDAESYFGLASIHLNRNNGIQEPVKNYILRHTMLLPRDVINIGNVFHEKISSATFNMDHQAALKESVNYVAKQLAKEQIAVASILISTNWIHKGATEDGSYNVYISPEMTESVSDILVRVISGIGKDRFSRAELAHAIKKLRSIQAIPFKDPKEPFDALFRAGLLGYVEENPDMKAKEIFFSESAKTPFSLPLSHSEYVFHSCLIDYASIKPIGGPVYV